MKCGRTLILAAVIICAAAAALKRGAVTGLSFGYRARGFTRSEAGRDLSDIDLSHIVTA